MFIENVMALNRVNAVSLIFVFLISFIAYHSSLLLLKTCPYFQSYIVLKEKNLELYEGK
jgi:hypothetical protein